MKRSMSRQAEAERERRSRVITAEGELQASQKLARSRRGDGRTPRRTAAAAAADRGRGRRGEELHARAALPRRAAPLPRTCDTPPRPEASQPHLSHDPTGVHCGLFRPSATERRRDAQTADRQPRAPVASRSHRCPNDRRGRSSGQASLTNCAWDRSAITSSGTPAARCSSSPASSNRTGTAHRRMVMVGVDGSSSSGTAIRFAFEEALRRGGAVRAVHVFDPSTARICREGTHAALSCTTRPARS